MILAAHQSHYLPALGYLDKIEKSDIFVLLDDVQFERNGWQNRNRIRTPKGIQWLTVPLIHPFSQSLREVQIDNHQKWRLVHLKTLTLNYQKAHHFRSCQGFLEETYSRSWDHLVDLNFHWLEFLLRAFQIHPKRLVRSSDLDLKGTGGTERLVRLCKRLGAETYLSGQGGKAYLDVARFETEGIRLLFQDYSVPPYEAVGFKTEEPLSAVDLLLNQGPNAQEILRRGRKQ